MHPVDRDLHRRRHRRVASRARPADGQPHRDGPRLQPLVACLTDPLHIVDRDDLVGLGHQDGVPAWREASDIVGPARESRDRVGDVRFDLFRRARAEPIDQPLEPVELQDHHGRRAPVAPLTLVLVGDDGLEGHGIEDGPVRVGARTVVERFGTGVTVRRAGTVHRGSLASPRGGRRRRGTARRPDVGRREHDLDHGESALSPRPIENRPRDRKHDQGRHRPDNEGVHRADRNVHRRATPLLRHAFRDAPPSPAGPDDTGS